MKRKITLLGTFLISSMVLSQVGIDTESPKATLDVVVSSNKLNQPFGIIAPRVTGIELRNAGGQFGNDQDGAIVYATSSAETVTGRAKDVTQKGYYYFDAQIDNGSSLGLWVALKNAPGDYVEPWVVQGGNIPATTNNQSISQNGSVVIGKSSAYNNTNQVMLDVVGAVRSGSGQTGVVGTNSVAMGSGNTASGNQSIALGMNTISSGSQSLAIGNASNASGNGSFAGGYYVTSGSSASGQSSFAYGANGTNSSGNYSFAFGNNAKAEALNSFAFGNGSVASNQGSLAFGNGSRTTADYAVAIGRNNTASGQYATALGQGNTASGIGSFVGGFFNDANSLGAYSNGVSSFAFGSNGVSANGDYSFAFGNNSRALGAYSIAFGNSANSLFNHGLAIGLGTITPVRSGIALGRYNRYTNENYTSGSNSNNLKGDPIFQVGQGSSNGVGRSNLITGYYGNNADGSFANGWVVIGANPSTIESNRLGNERLTIYGSIAATGSVNVGGSVNGNVTNYPDYVFQNYYLGVSNLNTSYKFKTLYEIEQFIKENHHLPGVTSVNSLNKTEYGYSINIGQTATESLEKVEELYLHTIEQQKQIDELKALVIKQQEQINHIINQAN